jgi:hypothetical protein
MHTIPVLFNHIASKQFSFISHSQRENLQQRRWECRREATLVCAEFAIR